MRRLLLLAAACAGSGLQPAHAQRTELKTELVTQQTPSWCWAATASMALEILGVPDINPGKNYQCGVVAAAFPRCDDDCSKCDTTIPTMKSLIVVLNRYRDLALEGKPPKSPFSPNYAAYPALDRIKHSLDRSYPVIAGISPDWKPDEPAEAEHAVLITGYEDDYMGFGETWIVVRDPYPYEPGENPWENAGYPYRKATGRALLPWSALREGMNFTSAVFLEARTAASSNRPLGVRRPVQLPSNLGLVGRQRRADRAVRLIGDLLPLQEKLSAGQ